MIRLLQQAADCPDYDAQLDYSLPPEQFLAQMLPIVQEFRSDAASLGVSFAAACESMETATKPCAWPWRLFGLPAISTAIPLLVSYLVAITIQRHCGRSMRIGLLQAGPVSKEVRQALDAELAIQERMEGYAWTIKSERAFGLDILPRHSPLRNFWLFSRGRWNRWESEYLDAMQAFLTLPGDRRPYRETIQDRSTASKRRFRRTKESLHCKLFPGNGRNLPDRRTNCEP